ncbi:integrase core domain protein [Burkholderia mallei]|nr:integrase core domain protein [Burkholderia mallei]
MLAARLVKLAHERRRFGYRRLHALVEREGTHANHKRIYRLYREAGLAVRRRRKRHGVMIEREQLALPGAPNEVWLIDFVMDALSNGRRVKCLTVVDDFTKEAVDIVVDHGISGLYVARALDHAARFRGYPKAVRTGQGPEFTSRALDQWAYANGVTLKLIQAASPRRMRTSNRSAASSATNALTSTGSRRSRTLGQSSRHGVRTTTSKGRTAH